MMHLIFMVHYNLLCLQPAIQYLDHQGTSYGRRHLLYLYILVYASSKRDTQITIEIYHEKYFRKFYFNALSTPPRVILKRAKLSKIQVANNWKWNLW